MAFTAWLALFGLIALAWLIGDSPKDRTVVASLAACGLSTLAFWCARGRLAPLVARWGASPGAKFVAIGSLGAAWVETVFWALERAFGASGVAASPNLALDLLATMPWYVPMVALLWVVQRRHRYSLYEVLMLGGVYELGADGIVGPFVGGTLAPASAPLAALLFPMLVIAYSFMVLPASALLRADLDALRGGAAPAGDATRYAYGLLPLLGLAPYVALGFLIMLA